MFTLYLVKYLQTRKYFVEDGKEVREVATWLSTRRTLMTKTKSSPNGEHGWCNEGMITDFIFHKESLQYLFPRVTLKSFVTHTCSL